jgi:hypothetical protein
LAIGGRPWDRKIRLALNYASPDDTTVVDAIIDRTPDMQRPGGWGNGYVERGHEIADWLDRHPEVRGFVILDDDGDMAHLKDSLVQTKLHDGGLTEELADRAIQRLRINELEADSRDGYDVYEAASE